MTETKQLYNSVAPLRNVSALVGLVERVAARAPGLPGMAVFHGPSGFGKTTAAVYAANRFDTYQVQVKSCWTGKKLCEAILSEMGIEPAKTIANMVDQIARELTLTDRPLLIDDAQELTSKSRMIKLVKDIYESCGTTIVLIGEELLPQQLARWENIHGRILAWVPAEPACLDDVRHLARIYAPGIELDPAFQNTLLARSHHSIRRVCNNLEAVREFAMTKGLERIDADAWEGQDFFRLDAPKPRRELAGVWAA